MPIHSEAQKGDVAKIALLCGDPKRAEYIAKNFLESTKLFNGYRLMYGFTGKYKGRDISVQTTGMGSPSISIIIEELNMLGVKSLIRVGTCGSINKKVNISDIVLAFNAHSSHGIYNNYFNGGAFSAGADFALSRALFDKSASKSYKTHCGSVLTSETFYEDSFDLYEKYAKFGTLAVEMESYALFLLSSKYNIKASTMLAVSDIVFEKKRGEKEQIKKGVDNILEIVLDTICENYDYLSGEY